MICHAAWKPEWLVFIVQRVVLVSMKFWSIALMACSTTAGLVLLAMWSARRKTWNQKFVCFKTHSDSARKYRAHSIRPWFHALFHVLKALKLMKQHTRNSMDGADLVLRREDVFFTLKALPTSILGNIAAIRATAKLIADASLDAQAMTYVRSPVQNHWNNEVSSPKVTWSNEGQNDAKNQVRQPSWNSHAQRQQCHVK